MSHLLKALRQTGRTTRLIAKAVEVLKTGVAVYLVVDSAIEQRRLLGLLESAASAAGVEFDRRNIRVVAAERFDWLTMTLPGVADDSVCLVDHSAIESRFSRLLAMLHAFDPEPTAPVVTQATPAPTPPPAG